MDGSVLESETEKHFQWALSPSLSETDEDFIASEIKTECVMDDHLFGRSQTPNKSCPVPMAGAAATAASLQSAFGGKKSLMNQKPGVQLTDNGFCSPSLDQIPSHSIKTEIGADGQIHTTPYTYANTVLPGQNTDISTVDGAEPAADAQQMDIYRDLILRHLIQDISTTCAKLGLPTDPYNWTPEHSWRWISEMCQQFNLPPPRQLFLNGRSLLAMSQKEFEMMAPEGGDTLHAQLQLWKTAFESYHQQQSCGHSSGMTAADNSLPKNWSLQMSDPVTMVHPDDVNKGPQRNDYQTYSRNDQIPMSNYYNTPSYQSPPPPQDMSNPFFANGILPSPSNSDMSSSASMQDMGEDEIEMQLNMLNMQRQPMNNGMPFNPMMNNGRMPGPQGRSDEARPAPFPPRHSGTVHLWHFIRELLDHPKQYGSCVRWVDRDEGTFKIESSHHLARFWGQRKNRAQMNYDKLSRSLRQYYKKGIIQKPEKKQRLVYKFLPPYNL